MLGCLVYFFDEESSVGFCVEGSVDLMGFVGVLGFLGGELREVGLAEIFERADVEAE